MRQKTVVVVARCEAEYGLSQDLAGAETRCKVKSGESRDLIRSEADCTAITDWNYNQYS